MLENKNMHRTRTRSIFTHTRNRAGFTIHSLVAAPSKFLRNVLETLTRQWILDFVIIGTCKNMLLVHVLCRFSHFDNFNENRWIQEQCLRPSPEQHFRRARANAAVKTTQNDARFAQYGFILMPFLSTSNSDYFRARIHHPKTIMKLVKICSILLHFCTCSAQILI